LILFDLNQLALH